MRSSTNLTHSLYLLGNRIPVAALPALPLRGAAPLRAHSGAMVLTGAGEGGFLPDLASGLLAGKYSAPTMWSAVVNDVTRVMICDGLPNDTKASALFDLDAPLWTEAAAP